MKDVTKVLAVAAIENEFKLATTGMDFTITGGKEMRQLLYTYFVAGVLFAQNELVPPEIWLAQTQAELTTEINKAIGEKNEIN